MSPYRRSSQTTENIASCFDEAQIAGFQEEVQLREQDFGNFQVGSAPNLAFLLACSCKCAQVPPGMYPQIGTGHRCAARW